MNSTIFSPLNETDFNEIVLAFKLIGWDKPMSTYERYFKEQSDGIRLVIIARESGKFCGYVTIKWKSDYDFFDKNNIPEIVDLNVLPHFRKRGIGIDLIKTCEKMVKERSYKTIGLGVGMTADYGNAQRLYVNLGYVPDGHGLHYKNKPLNYGDQATVDDDLVLYFTKLLKST